jgi:hypothetical protein
MNIIAFEPLMPPEGGELEELAGTLVACSHRLAGRLHANTRAGIGDLVRWMNCYYSNLIEGHNTPPRDIDRALVDEYSRDPNKRALQKEARAHIEVQRMIDGGHGSPGAAHECEISQVGPFRVLQTSAPELLVVRHPNDRWHRGAPTE